MKKIVNIVITIWMSSIGISCDDWLDVRPENQATSEVLLSTSDGYRALLLGIYQKMASYDLYGADLTFGLVDCISQQYKLDGAINIAYQSKYVNAAKLDYTHPNVSTAIDEIWEEAYNTIANANNLIQVIEHADPELFNSKTLEKNMILGEAYACRALLHFDLLRLFAPSTVNDDGRSYIPYVEQYPDIMAPTIPVKDFLSKVIRDLERGRELVVEWDTSLVGQGTLITGNARFRNEFSSGTTIYSNSSNWEDFFKGRGYRLNYYAITALLARAYQYVEEHTKAFDCAKEILDLEIRDNSGMVKAFDRDDFSGIQSTNWEIKRDLKVVSNLIFAVYNAQAYDEYALHHFFAKSLQGSSFTLLIINRDEQKIWETRGGTDESSLDYRSVYWTFFGGGQYPLSGKYYLSDDEGIRDRSASITPIIRATEMHYIMAETYARAGNYALATAILTELRRRRGCTETLSISNWTEFQEELIRDARREWISEGQLFYLYKRLDAPVNFGRNIIRPLTRAEYLLPIPADQIF
jgi:hypothetical protein